MKLREMHMLISKVAIDSNGIYSLVFLELCPMEELGASNTTKAFSFVCVRA